MKNYLHETMSDLVTEYISNLDKNEREIGRVSDFLTHIYWAIEEAHLKEDIVCWLTDNHPNYLEDEFVEKMCNVYHKNFNADNGIWENIESAFYYLTYDYLVG